jgi:hypothetical protein
MTIGHVAVVGGVLLGGDNPSAWEAAVLESDKDRHPRTPNRSGSITDKIRRWSESSLQKRRILLPARIKNTIYLSGFSSRYKTAWMWSRGSTKAMWIAKVSQEYPALNLQKVILKLSCVDWILKLALPAILLFVIPAFLGGMIRYVKVFHSIFRHSRLSTTYCNFLHRG